MSSADSFRPARLSSVVRSSGLGPVALGAAVGRLGYAVLPLCLLFAAADAMGSFSLAAAAVALFGLATLAMPVQSRLLDRRGQRRVLPIGAAAQAVVLLGLAGCAFGAVASPAVWLSLCVLAGALAPALGPSMRAQWRARCSEADLSAAYAFDSIVEETVFLVGPVIAAGVVAVAAPGLGVVAAAVLVPIGALSLALSGAAPQPAADADAVPPDPSSPSSPVAPSSPLRTPSWLLLLAALGLFGASGAVGITAVASLAYAADRPGVLGVVEAISGVAAVGGGVWWGARARRGPARPALAALLLARVPLLAVAALAPGISAVGLLVAATGFWAAPAFVAAFGAADEATPVDRRTEASTWITTAANVGTAIGTAIAGRLAVVWEPGWVLALAAVAGLIAAACARWHPARG